MSLADLMALSPAALRLRLLAIESVCMDYADGAPDRSDVARLANELLRIIELGADVPDHDRGYEAVRDRDLDDYCDESWRKE